MAFVVLLSFLTLIRGCFVVSPSVWLGLNRVAVKYVPVPRADFTQHFGQISKDKLF